MFKAIFSLAGIAFLTASVLAAEAEPGSQLGKGISVPSNMGFASNISPDGQAATIIFDSMLVDIGTASQTAGGTHNQTAVQTKLATLHVPYTTDQRSVRMTMDLRGFADVDAAASARLVACVGNKTEAVNLSAEEGKKVELKGKCKCVMAEQHPDSQFGDWQDRIEFVVQTHAAKPVLQITLLLVVEHDTDTADAGGALLVVDSLDLEISKSAKGSYRR